MKLLRVEYKGATGIRWLPVTYCTSKAEAVRKAKAIHKQATNKGRWRVRECEVPSRLSTSEWCEVLRYDMLAPEVGECDDTADRTVTDFVTAGKTVAQSRKPKKENASE